MDKVELKINRNETINADDYYQLLNQLEEKQKKINELDDINDKLSSALNDAEERIDKAIKYLDFNPTKSIIASADILSKILKGKDI